MEGVDLDEGASPAHSQTRSRSRADRVRRSGGLQQRRLCSWHGGCCHGSADTAEIKLQGGDCYIDSSGELEIVPCDTPHDAEVVLYAPLAESDLDEDGGFVVPPEGEEALAECLGVSVDEVDAVLEERSLGFAMDISRGTHELYRENEAGYHVAGGLEEPICPQP